MMYTSSGEGVSQPFVRVLVDGVNAGVRSKKTDPLAELGAGSCGILPCEWLSSQHGAEPTCYDIIFTIYFLLAPSSRDTKCGGGAWLWGRPEQSWHAAVSDRRRLRSVRARPPP